MDEKTLKELQKYGKGFLAGEAAVLFASIINTQVYNQHGIWWSAGVSAPIVEELAKTGLADAMKGDILTSHVTFGSTEGYMYAQKKTQVDKFDHRRPLLHASFGVLGLLGRHLGGNKSSGYLTSIFAHFVWNQIALYRAWLKGELPESEPDHGPFVTAAEVDEPRKEAVSWEDVKRKLLI